MILKILGYKMNSISLNEHYPPWRRRLEEQIKATGRGLSQLSELQKGVGKTEMPKKYNKMPIPEALEITMQRFTAQATLSRRSIVSQSGLKTDLPRAETQQYWKGTWQEATHLKEGL